jgi:signal transduction histidine kinase
MAFWNQLASGRPKTMSAVSPPAGGRAIAERVSDSGKGVWQYGGWGGRPKWRTVFACPLEAHGAAGVLVLCDRERRPRDERLSARIEWIGQQIGVWIEHQSAEDQLRRREAEYRQLSRGLLHDQDDERRRLARELHDSTTQHLAALLMNLDRIGKADKPLDSRLRHLVTESRLLAEQCVGEIRTIANRLQPPLLDEMGLVSAVRWFVARFTERSGIRVEVVVRDVGRLIVAVERVLFRVVQESLVNIERHAASPTAVVSLAAANGDLLLEVRDQGRGLRAGGPGADRRLRTAKTGAGILAMRERIDQLGGEFDIQFTDHGTTVQVRVPLQEGNR